MCPFEVRVTVRCSLADFLGSLVTHAITSPRRGRCTIRFQLGMWICLHPSMPTPFNALFRQRAVVSLLRPRVRRTVSDGILTVSAIGLGASLNLRTVIVTAAVYRGFNSMLHTEVLTSPLNLPAPGRCQAVYLIFRVCTALCFC